MSGQSPFQPRIVAALGAALIVLLAASLLLSGTGRKRLSGDSVGPNTYSRSAVGHFGLFDILPNLGYKVVRGERDVLAQLGANGALVLAEPATLSGSDNTSKLLGATRILVVLPKRNVRRSDNHDGWIAEAQLAPAFIPQSVFYAVAGSGDVVRVEAPSTFNKSLVVPDPIVNGSMQLVKNSKLKPLVSTAEGVLLGEFREGRRKIWVLADPDIIENHGITKGDNVAFADAVVKGLLDGKVGTLVFDETVHGFQRAAQAPTKFLSEFPYNLIALQIIVGAALLLLAAMGRFGTPEIPERALKTGKRDLIRSAASLIDYAGHHAAILKRYSAIVVQDAGRLLRAPRQLSEADLTSWLDKTGAARGVPSACRDLLKRAAAVNSKDLGALLFEARAIYRWKKDILNGVSGRLGDH